jgi:hypothetical protein
VGSLGALESAAARAADDVSNWRSGKRAILPWGCIRALADIYQKFTGRTPGTGIGPFYRFVVQFRAALDPSYETTDENGEKRVDESIVDSSSGISKLRISSSVSVGRGEEHQATERPPGED